MITTEEDGKGCLGQHNIDTVRECIENGFERYFKLSPEARVDFTARSRASIINDFIRAEAKKRFYEASNIQLYQIRGLFLVDFGDIQLRFKKLNEQLHPQNISTNQTLIFMGQGILPGIPMATKVVAGYQPDASFSAIKYIGILCFTGSRYQWKIDLNRAFTPPIPLEYSDSDVPSQKKEKVTLKEGMENGNERKKNI